MNIKKILSWLGAESQTASSSTNVTGQVRVRVFERGRLVSQIEHKNLVVSAGRNSLIDLVTGVSGAATDKEITQIAVGTNNASPSLSDTSITNDVKKAIATVTPSPGTRSVNFQTTFDSSDANGTQIEELGLYTADNTLFARVNSISLTKTNLISLEISWSIFF